MTIFYHLWVVPSTKGSATKSLAALRLCGFALKILAFPLCVSAGSPHSDATVLLVVGAPGQPEFGSNFLRQATLWQTACAAAGCRPITIGLQPGATNDYELLRSALAAEPREGATPLWLVLIGHGTFDGQ